MAEGGGALRELLAVFGFGVDTEELKKGENKLEDFLGKVKQVATGIAAAFAGHEIFEFAEGQARAMTSIERTSAALGISAEKVQALQYASRSLGMESDHLLNLMGRLQVSQQGAAAGSGHGADAFRRLGVNVKDASGHMKSADVLFSDLAEGISKVKDPSEAAALATQIFGRSGRELLPFLKQGKAGIAGLLDEYEQLGGGYTKDAIEKSKEFEKAQARLGLVQTGLASVISSKLLPVLTKITEWATKAVGWFSKMVRGSNLVQAAMITLGAAATYFAIQMAIASAPVLLIAAAVGALILVVDDLIALFNGDRSLIGDTMDKIFGKGTSSEFVKDLKDAWIGFKAVLVEVWDKLKPIYDAMKWIAHKSFHLYKDAGELSGIVGDELGRSAVEKADEEYSAKHPGAPSTQPGGGLPQFGPGSNISWDAMAPVSAPGVSNNVANSTSNNVNVNITVPPGLNEKQIGEHVADQIDQRLNQRHRAAAATLQRGGS